MSRRCVEKRIAYADIARLLCSFAVISVRCRNMEHYFRRSGADWPLLLHVIRFKRPVSLLSSPATDYQSERLSVIRSRAAFRALRIRERDERYSKCRMFHSAMLRSRGAALLSRDNYAT